MLPRLPVCLNLPIHIRLGQFHHRQVIMSTSNTLELELRLPQLELSPIQRSCLESPRPRSGLQQTCSQYRSSSTQTKMGSRITDSSQQATARSIQTIPGALA